MLGVAEHRLLAVRSAPIACGEGSAPVAVTAHVVAVARADAVADSGRGGGDAPDGGLADGDLAALVQAADEGVR